ncbi:MAG: hypothetical protein AAFX76_12410 [Planctomycetota bacterium]
MVVLLSILVSACVHDPIVPENLTPDPPQAELPDELPTYVELIGRYNENAGALDRLWARTKVELRWRDERGRARRESGDGRLIFERPLNTAWTVEVLGDIKLWAGSDVRGFWLFDRLGDGVAYYGAYGRPLSQPLPLPVQPEAVPYLIGLVPVDPTRTPPPPAVEAIDGYLVVEPPGLNLRLTLDPVTARPVRIDLTDGLGQSVLTSVLTGELSVAATPDDRVDPVTTAVLPKKAELYPQGDESRMTVTLVRASGDDQNIRRKWFDFDLLRTSLKPDEVVNLN